MRLQEYKIIFISLDGNEQSVIIDADSKGSARWIFEDEYKFETIVSISKR